MNDHKPLSALGMAAWTDLRRSLMDSAVSDLRGTPRKKVMNGRGYWYDHFRVGNETADRYLGEDSDAMRGRLARQKQIANAEKTAARERARLVRTLRAEGFRMSDVGTGQVVAALAKSGVFRLGGTLVGTVAFNTYEGELGIRFTSDTAIMTDDIDIASFERLSLALGDTVNKDLQKVFADLSFDPIPSLDAGQVWKWRQTERQTLVEFLTPSFDDAEDIRELPALGVSAQSLHFLNYLIAEPILVPFLYRSGILVQVPRPERFAIHKLIVADRRRDGPEATKSFKDRAQAETLISILASERPIDLSDAYQDALSRGPSWRRHISATLARLPETDKILADLKNI